MTAQGMEVGLQLSVIQIAMQIGAGTDFFLPGCLSGVEKVRLTTIRSFTTGVETPLDLLRGAPLIVAKKNTSRMGDAEVSGPGVSA